MLDRAPSWLVIAGSCLATLTTVGIGAWTAWSDHAPWRGAPAIHRPDAGPDPVAPRAFPYWVEVPHLDGPAADGPGPHGQPAPRSFLVPRPFPAPRPEPAGRLTILPPADRPARAFAAATVDAKRWMTEAMAPARAGGPAPAPAEVALLPPDDAPTLGPPTAVPARPVVRPTPRPPARPVIEARRPARRGDDADQTASIVDRAKPGREDSGREKPGRTRSDRAGIEAGAVARASVHRARPGASPDPRAPAAPWTLPPALAPSP